jgi:hypothetical protein
MTRNPSGRTLSDRDDMLIGTVVALLDLYRMINGRKPVVTQFEIRTGAVCRNRTFSA